MVHNEPKSGRGWCGHALHVARKKSLTYTAAVHLPCSFSGLASRVASAYARTSPDEPAFPSLCFRTDIEGVMFASPAPRFAQLIRAPHDVLRQPMYLSMLRGIFQTLFQNVRNFTFGTHRQVPQHCDSATRQHFSAEYVGRKSFYNSYVDVR